MDDRNSRLSLGTLSPVSTFFCRRVISGKRQETVSFSRSSIGFMIVSNTPDRRTQISAENSFALSLENPDDSIRSFNSTATYGKLSASQVFKRSRDVQALEQKLQTCEMKIARQSIELEVKSATLIAEKSHVAAPSQELIEELRLKDRKVNILEAKVESLIQENERLRNEETVLKISALKKENAKLMAEVDSLKQLQTETKKEHTQQLKEYASSIQRLQNDLHAEREISRKEMQAQSLLLQKVADYNQLKRKCESLENASISNPILLDMSSEHKKLSNEYLLLMEKFKDVQRVNADLKSKYEELLSNKTTPTVPFDQLATSTKSIVLELQEENKELLSKNIELEKKLSAIPSVPTPTQESQPEYELKLLELQRKLEISEYKILEFKSEVSVLKRSSAHLQQQLDLEKSKASKLESEINHLQLKSMHVEKGLEASQLEASTYAELLDSYRKGANTSKAVHTSDEDVLKFEKSIGQLDRVLEIFQKINLEYSILQQASRDASPQAAAVAESPVNAQISQLEQRNAALESENAVLSQNLADLEEKLIKAESSLSQYVDSSKTKVMRLSGGPSAEAQLLREKCAELEKTVQLLKSQSSQATNSCNQEALIEEIEKLKNEKKDSQLHINRLSEVFKKKSRAFREACYHLLGYHVDMGEAPNGHLYTLVSAYAASRQDTLVFRISNGGTVSLLDSPFASSLDPSLTEYLTRFKSYPAFLSSLTIKQFENSTLS
eukprot:TRINITY_DN7133_c0_g1_i6.p1 TRINITY_DN7133_c0_g1~~TRINITY_DN7133_c0_g1_i6.p1  ORF type:complete len:727 (-),score=163.97 TRINITY_DN7133_c0_g1_i6:151-2331(-)